MALMACEVASKAFPVAQAHLLISIFRLITMGGMTNIVKDTYSAGLKRCKSLIQGSKGEIPSNLG